MKFISCARCGERLPRPPKAHIEVVEGEISTAIIEAVVYRCPRCNARENVQVEK